MNATWPLARLAATPERLVISVFLSGKYEFAPQEVVAIERYVMIPVMGWGVRIVHCRSDYPRHFVFWCLGAPESVLRGIHEAGFIPSASAVEIPPRRGFPVRWSVIIGAVIVWNGLFMLAHGRSGGNPPQPEPLFLVPLVLLLTLSLATLWSPKVQSLVLKPGRQIGEIRGAVRLLAFISGFMVAVFSIILACGGFNQHH
jgi:hypothetical protein